MRARRSRRVALGFIGATIVAASAGAYVGMSSHTTREALTEAQRAARQRDIDISSEINRTLLELWKMEDVEALRNRGRTR